jgi:hypothetical protein
MSSHHWSSSPTHIACDFCSARRNNNKQSVDTISEQGMKSINPSGNRIPSFLPLGFVGLQQDHPKIARLDRLVPNTVILYFLASAAVVLWPFIGGLRRGCLNFWALAVTQEV